MKGEAIKLRSSGDGQRQSLAAGTEVFPWEKRLDKILYFLEITESAGSLLSIEGRGVKEILNTAEQSLV